MVIPWWPSCNCFRTAAHLVSGMSSASPFSISPSSMDRVEACVKYLLRLFGLHLHPLAIHQWWFVPELATLGLQLLPPGMLFSTVLSNEHGELQCPGLSQVLVEGGIWIRHLGESSPFQAYTYISVRSHRVAVTSSFTVIWLECWIDFSV